MQDKTQERIANYLNWCVNNYSTHKRQAIEVQEYIKKLEAQLARLDDVEGLVGIIHEKGNCCQTLNESKGIALAVINYIKGE